jgi:DNA-binding response OmpR family regulator
VASRRVDYDGIEVLAVSSEGPINDELPFDAPLGSETVLIVDDEPLVLRLCCSILARQGYHVLGAASAQEALQFCESGDRELHLLLSDVIMPNLRGSDLAARVAMIYPQIRILFMSGFDGRDIPEYKTLRTRAKLIPKPFTPRELLLAVRAALDNPTGM